MMQPVITRAPACPVILAMPHSGTYVPDDIRARLNKVGHALTDTDWHIPKLYEDLLPEAGMVQATFHRYVIDANRPPDGASLYPGQNTTGLIPLTDFDDQSLWRHGCEPDEADTALRLAAFHAPYHAALAEMIEQTRARFGFAILYDCHSIRSHIPHLFDGALPTLNVGTFDGKSCAPIIQNTVMNICTASGFSHVLNGRFKGGWTTRHYGRPHENIHAIQMELAQSAYMDEALPFAFAAHKAEVLRETLGAILSALKKYTPQGD